MQPLFLPLSEVSHEAVKRYFAANGYTAEIAEWKYLDRRFNRDRERGYAWMHDGSMAGFIGLIPFRAANGSECVEAAWTVDWGLREPNLKKGGVGVMLMWQALRSYPLLFGLGGNERSRALFPKMARKIVEDAAVALYLPLRFGAALRALPRLVPAFRPDTLERLFRFPLRRLASHPMENLVRIEPGVSCAIGGLLDRAAPAAGWYPRYDFEYLNWQLGRCPALDCFSCFIPSDGGPHAAVLFWRQHSSVSYWRMAVLTDGEEPDQRRPLVSRAIRQVYTSGGNLVAALVSHLDSEPLEILKAAGFLAAPNRRTLYVLAGRNKPLPVDELRQLSYLDSDLAHFL